MTTINNTSADAERAAFEAELRKLDLTDGALDRWPSGSYRHAGTDGRWKGWQLARAATTADVAADSIAPMTPHGTLLPEGDEFVRLMSAWRMADIGDQSRAAFDAVVSHIDAWGARLAAGAPAETVKAPTGASICQAYRKSVENAALAAGIEGKWDPFMGAFRVWMTPAKMFLGDRWTPTPEQIKAGQRAHTTTAPSKGQP